MRHLVVSGTKNERNSLVKNGSEVRYTWSEHRNRRDGSRLYVEAILGRSRESGDSFVHIWAGPEVVT